MQHSSTGIEATCDVWLEEIGKIICYLQRAGCASISRVSKVQLWAARGGSGTHVLGVCSAVLTGRIAGTCKWACVGTAGQDNVCVK